jgi:hypothetical protein
MSGLEPLTCTLRVRDQWFRCVFFGSNAPKLILLEIAKIAQSLPESMPYSFDTIPPAPTFS